MSERMKPTLTFTIVCDDIRQEVGGKISLMGLFESIFSTQFPVMHPRLAIMAEWTCGRGEFETRFRLLSPDRKQTLRETSSRLKLAESGMRHRDISIHLNIEFRTPGVYWIEHYLDNELVSSQPLNVIQVKETSFH
ncbi:MAG: hypothetical protein OHK006_21550 [Thermodesulfovibrionales bacterium]